MKSRKTTQVQWACAMTALKIWTTTYTIEGRARSQKRQRKQCKNVSPSSFSSSPVKQLRFAKTAREARYKVTISFKPCRSSGSTNTHGWQNTIWSSTKKLSKMNRRKSRRNNPCKKRKQQKMTPIRWRTTRMPTKKMTNEKTYLTNSLIN